MNRDKKIFLAMLVFFICSSLIKADIVWEGTAAMSRHGEFPVKGFFGASNSFHVNTIISVENLRNNKVVEVVIVDNLNNNNLFLLISRDAADVLDIKQDEISPVKMQVVREGPAPPARASGSDPGSAVESILSRESAAASGAVTTLPRRVVIISDEVIDPLAEKSVAEPVATATPIGEATPARSVIAAENTNEATPARSVIAAANINEATPASADAPLPVAPMEAIDTVAIVDNEPAVALGPADSGGARVFFLRPTDPRPPVVEDSDGEALSGLVSSDTSIVRDTPAASSAVAPAPAVSAIAPRTPAAPIIEGFYVQLISFKDYSKAEEVMNSINIGYPVIIHYDEKQDLYQIMVGPLKTDERGAALHRARNSGYRDAFIRRR